MSMGRLRMPATLSPPKFFPNPKPISRLPLSRISPWFPKKTHPVHAGKLEGFLDLKSEAKPEFLDIELRWHDSWCKYEYDVVIIGAGPAGLRLAEKVSCRGIRACCIDPSPLSIFPNNYGVWVDEFDSMGLTGCLNRIWPMASVFIDDQKTKYLSRPYGRVCRKGLKTMLMEACASQGVRFHRAKACTVDHQEFKSTVSCSDGSDIHCSLVVDASGFSSDFLEYDKPRNHGYQLAHGILAEVEEHPFDLNKMVFMDWRDTHMGNEPYLRAGNQENPSFLYAMPFDSNLVFLEETSLVGRPVLSYKEIKKRMVARLRNLGIRVKRVIEDEKCLIPMGGPLPRLPQCVMGVGGAAGVVHPATGYMVARSLALVPAVADAMVECLGSTRMIRGRQLHRLLWSSLWTKERRIVREVCNFGMEVLLRLDLRVSRRFIDAFFDLDPYYWHGFLSSRLSPAELFLMGPTLFGHASSPCRLDMVTKTPVPMVRMVRNLVLDSV